MRIFTPKDAPKSKRPGDRTGKWNQKLRLLLVATQNLVFSILENCHVELYSCCVVT
jgi:hypothetical protein